MCDNSQDRIDSFIRGEMSIEDMKRFESDIEEYSALYKDYIETKAIADVIADRGRKLSMMNSWKEEENRRELTYRRRKYLRGWIIGLGAAACLSFGFFLLKPIIFQSISNNSFEMPHFSHDYYLYGENTGLDVLDSMINSKDFSNALAFAHILINENKQHIEQNNKNNNTYSEFDIVKYGRSDSISILNSDRIIMYEELMYIVEWRRINLLLALEKKDECIEALNDFTITEGIYKTEAVSLLKKLSNTHQ